MISLNALQLIPGNFISFEMNILFTFFSGRINFSNLSLIFYFNTYFDTRKIGLLLFLYDFCLEINIMVGDLTEIRQPISLFFFSQKRKNSNFVLLPLLAPPPHPLPVIYLWFLPLGSLKLGQLCSSWVIMKIIMKLFHSVKDINLLFI